MCSNLSRRVLKLEFSHYLEKYLYVYCIYFITTNPFCTLVRSKGRVSTQKL